MLPLAKLAVLLALVQPQDGWFAVVCGVVGAGKTKEAAAGECRKERKKQHLSPGACGCARADLVQVKKDEKPAMVSLASCEGNFTGSTLAFAVAACKASQAQKLAAGGQRAVCDCETGTPTSLYGPFKRKAAASEYDDAKSYVFLGEDGGWYSATGDQPCLVAGTMIATPAGERPIESLGAGDWVLTWSPGRAATTAARIVRAKRRPVAGVFHLTLADGKSLRATGNHPLFVPERGLWQAAGALRPGDEVSVVDGARLGASAVRSLVWEATPTDVYDLTVEGERSYLAGGVWVHNY